jgi:hypothetical protein
VSVIHLITKSGPEWQIPIEAWTTKRAAQAKADRLNLLREARVERARQAGGGLSSGVVEDSLSHYEVVPVNLRAEAQPVNQQDEE